MSGCDLVRDGYVPCACRDCMEIAIGARGDALCSDCEEAGCEAGAEEECSAPGHGVEDPDRLQDEEQES